MKLIGLLCAGLIAATVAVAGPKMEEGKEYVKLAQPQPVSSGDKIEVIEFFWYGCPHCYHLEPEVSAWLKNKPDDVEFIRIPAVLGPSWELLARGYYTAEVLGVLDKIHAPLFEYLHKERKRIKSVDDLRAFFVKQGVSAEDFDNTYHSFAVVTKTNRANQADERYGVEGVPSLIVGGEYRTSMSMAGSGGVTPMEVVDYLIEQERSVAGTQEHSASVR
jgi:thiol:disulfide interchange protein DsbA